MTRTTLRLAGLGLVALLIALGDDIRAAANGREAELIAVLKSSAPLKQKADACRELAHRHQGIREALGRDARR